MNAFLIALCLHIGFLLIWSAALLYMPVLFLQHGTATDSDVRRQLEVMQRALYAIVMTPAALFAVAAGTWLVFERGFQGGWLHVKLALVVLLAWYHVHCGHIMVKSKRRDRPLHPLHLGGLLVTPAALISAILWLVTGKPF